MTAKKVRPMKKEIATTVTFSNAEVMAILLEAAGAPDGVKSTALRDQDGEGVYLDFQVVWWVTEESATP